MTRTGAEGGEKGREGEEVWEGEGEKARLLRGWRGGRGEKEKGDRRRVSEGREEEGRPSERRGSSFTWIEDRGKGRRQAECWQRQGSRAFSGVINARGKGFPLSRRFRPRSMVSGAG